MGVSLRIPCWGILTEILLLGVYIKGPLFRKAPKSWALQAACAKLIDAAAGGGGSEGGELGAEITRQQARSKDFGIWRWDVPPYTNSA